MRGTMLALTFLASAMLPAFAQAPAGTAPAAPPAEDAALKQLTNKLMQETKMVTVTNVPTADGFVEDDDPNTMQIVFLEGPKAGPSHISDDGEVVFINGGSINEQSRLITLAFEKKAKLILEKKKKE